MILTISQSMMNVTKGKRLHHLSELQVVLLFDRIKKSFRLEKISEITESKLCLITTLSTGPWHWVQHLVISWAPPECWFHHLSVQSIPMLKNPFHEEFPPHVWSEPLWSPRTACCYVLVSYHSVPGRRDGCQLLQQYVCIVTECQVQEDWKTASLLVQPWCSGNPKIYYSRFCPESFLISSGSNTSKPPWFQSLFQSSVTLTEKFFFIFTCNLLCSSFCPLPPVLYLVTTKESLPLSYWHSPLYILR